MPHPKVKIADNSGNEVAVTDNALHVNVAGATMSTGDIEVNSEFPAAATITDNFVNPSTTSVMSMGMAWDGAAWDRLVIGGGTEAAALRVTLANDSTGVISIDDGGNTITVDGTVQENGDALTALQKIDDIQDTIGTDGDTGPTKCISIGGTYQTNGSIQEIQVNSSGQLMVDITSASTGASGATVPFKIDSIAYNTGDVGIMAKVVCSDTLATLTNVTNGEISSLQVDTQGALYTTHGVTGMAQGITTVGESAMQLDEGTNGYDISCKRVDLMSRHDNAGTIYVGSANTIASNGTVGGIRLDAGDFYSMDINNLTHIWVEATEADQELIFIYYT